MFGDLSLFGDDEQATTSESPVRELPIASWQVDLLRKTLDSRGLTTMLERQHAVEAAAGRPVESLRALTHSEAMQVLDELGRTTPMSAAKGSSWDDREEDTWIDQL